MLYGNIINLNENGQRVDAKGNPAPWMEEFAQEQPSFKFFTDEHGGVFSIGTISLEDGTKVPQVLCADGTKIRGGKTVREAADAARAKGDKFSLQACQVGGYIRGEYVPNEEGIDEYRECLHKDGRPVVQYTMFLPGLESDPTLTV